MYTLELRTTEGNGLIHRQTFTRLLEMSPVFYRMLEDLQEGQVMTAKDGDEVLQHVVGHSGD